MYSSNPMSRSAADARRSGVLAAFLALVALATLVSAPGPADARTKRRLPPDVVLHPDRGMGFTRFSKSSHDQRLFKPLNDATRLPTRDPGLDPYNLIDRGVSTYDIQTGQIRGSLTDYYSTIRHGEETDRRNRQQRARIDKASSPEGVISTFKSLQSASRATVTPNSGSGPAHGTPGSSNPAD